MEKWFLIVAYAASMLHKKAYKYIIFPQPTQSGYWGLLGFSDFSLKLRKYLMYPNGYFVGKKSAIKLRQKTQAFHSYHQSFL